MSLNAPIAPVSPRLGLEEVLDQHAELRDVSAQLRHAADARILSGLLQRLDDLLQHHFAHEESDRALRRALEPDGAGARGAGLLEEHAALLAELRELVARVEKSESRCAAAFAPEVAALVSRLAAHDARELRQLGAGIDAAAFVETPDAGATALAVNLRRTAVDVAIPAEHALLLEMVGTRHGVREATRKLLREMHHRYASWPETLEELHRHAMGDLSYYLEHPAAADAIAVFDSLYARVVEHARDPAVRESAIRQWLAFLEKVVGVSGDALPLLAPALERAASRLEVILDESPSLAVSASGRLRHLAKRLEEVAPEGLETLRERVRFLLVSVLRRTYTRWLAEPDAEAWWRAHCAGTALPEALAAISHTRVRQHLAQLEALTADAEAAGRSEALLALPDDARIARLHLEAIPHVHSAEGDPEADRIARIQWQIRTLSIAALAPIHRQTLTEIDHAYRGALVQADPASFSMLLEETFEALRRSPLSATPAAFGLMSRIGVEVLRSGDPERVAQVIEAFLGVDLPGPSFAGFTNEWRVQVDPAHLAAVRAWLAVIRENPPLALPLIAALTVHLKQGGMFVADTDLFQKDVSALLNSRIKPVYHPVKQLLRLFPVYFDDIGAEGPLRDVSSRIDEIQARQDPLCHFLRKQCHVECNPRVLGLIDAIGATWADGDPAPLRPFLPQGLYEVVAAAGCRSGAQRAFAALAAPGGAAAAFALPPEEVEARLAAIPDLRPADREKAALLVRLHGLVRQKYALDHDDLLDRLSRFHRAEPHEIEALRRALDAQRHEEALSLLLDLLERVKEIVTRPERTEGHEEIYRKRHIAVGIPSLYGRYREEKQGALGLGFRIESLASALFERMLTEDPPAIASADALRKTARRLRLLLRAVRVDGCHARGLEIGTAMLEHALDAPGTPLGPYVDVFQILERAIEQLIRLRFVEPYGDVCERILAQRRGGTRDADGAGSETAREQALEASEAFLRSAIAASFGLQALDRVVAQMLHVLTDARDTLPPQTGALLVGLDLERCCVPIDACEGRLDNPVLLGNKGFLLERLARLGLPVPPGFVVTTEAHRGLDALQSCPALRHALHERVRADVGRIERATGCRFGDARRPLLLSVRSSAAISMPGVLDTFLDVGINEEIAEGLAASRGSWGAWDAYRRFLQFWGMGHGVARSAFDALMREFKADRGVAKKAEIPPREMRELALAYRHLLEAQGVRIPDDPARQLERCVEMVMRSWEGQKARAYRSALQIAEEWGTAVVVQAMVYGNLGPRSGTGVAFTCDPRRPTDAVELHGDFVVQGQGDDVVGGLVSTSPLGEAQRRAERPDCPQSLERDFPSIHRALERHARTLFRHQDGFHQEIEFTFESDDPRDLHVLQTRDLVLEEVAAVTAFVPDPSLERDRLATGIGAGGGCVSGRVARTAGEIAELRARFPEEPIILLRPDTVPDDIPLVLAVEGLVTAIGGATSHAALVAQRLGRSCVVGCRDLALDDARGGARFGAHAIAKGEILSISGIDGSIYRGRHPATTVRRRRLL